MKSGLPMSCTERSASSVSTNSILLNIQQCSLIGWDKTSIVFVSTNSIFLNIRRFSLIGWDKTSIVSTNSIFLNIRRFSPKNIY